VITSTETPAGAVAARAAVAAGVAAAVNLAIWAVGDSAFDPIKAPAGSDVTRLVPLAVVVATAVGVGLAAAAAVLLRRAPRPRQTFLAVVAVGTLLSLGGPFSGDLDTANAGVLALMHGTTGAIAAVSLAPLLPRTR
jgi:hypothetical protein